MRERDIVNEIQMKSRGITPIFSSTGRMNVQAGEVESLLRIAKGLAETHAARASFNPLTYVPWAPGNNSLFLSQIIYNIGLKQRELEIAAEMAEAANALDPEENTDGDT